MRKTVPIRVKILGCEALFFVIFHGNIFFLKNHLKNILAVLISDKNLAPKYHFFGLLPAWKSAERG